LLPYKSEGGDEEGSTATYAENEFSATKDYVCYRFTKKRGS